MGVRRLHIIIAIFVLSIPVLSNAQPIFKCVSEDGSIVFANVPCVRPSGNSEFLGMGAEQNKSMATSSLGSASQSEQDLDNSARIFGFRDYQHFLQAKEVCMLLLKNNPLIRRGCGSDLKCLQEEKAAMQQRYLSLSQSNEWVANNCGAVARIVSSTAGVGDASGTPQRDEYLVNEAYNEEIFVINGSDFEAQSYCMDLDEGDRVIFVSGSPLGACSSAEVINVRTGTKCSLWCE